MPQLPYDNAQVPEDDRQPIPGGRYTALIAESQLLGNKSGNGQHIRLTFKIAGGPMNNRVIGNNYNVVHEASPEAERIGRQQLKSVAIAAGVPAMVATEELHGRQIGIHVVENGTYTDVQSVYPVSGTVPTTPTASTPGAAPAPATPGAAPKAPWDA